MLSFCLTRRNEREGRALSRPFPGRGAPRRDRAGRAPGGRVSPRAVAPSRPGFECVRVNVCKWASDLCVAVADGGVIDKMARLGIERKPDEPDGASVGEVGLGVLLLADLREI